MTQILDIIDDTLQQVEDQLLQEFDRIRNTLSDDRFEAIDPQVHHSLSAVVTNLYSQLEHTGDASNLELMSERHETLFSRMSVMKQLLNSKVPTAFLHEAHEEVITNRRLLEAKVTAQRRNQENSNDKSTGLFGKIRGILAEPEQSERTIANNQIKVTEEERRALEPMSIYLDNGIYSASRELAALANVFTLPEQVQQEMQTAHEEKMRAEMSGKAQFSSRNLSQQPPQPQEPPRPRPKPKAPLAQTPEEIRSKLAERHGESPGKASFGAKDIEHAKALEEQPKKQRELSATEIAAQRRAELDAEKAKQPTTGKASFVSKDIEPIVPQDAPRKRPVPPPVAKTEPEPERPTTGKAVFESRDLSQSPPSDKS